MDELKEYTIIELRLPLEFNSQVEKYIAKLSNIDSQIAKENLILKFAMIGFLQEENALNEYLK